MIPNAIEGCTRRLGKSQGYLGLPIKDTQMQDGQPVMVSSWQLTPDEVRAIAAGASVYLWVVGAAQPPLMLTVGEVPT